MTESWASSVVVFGPSSFVAGAGGPSLSVPRGAAPGVERAWAAEVSRLASGLEQDAEAQLGMLEFVAVEESLQAGFSWAAVECVATALQSALPSRKAVLLELLTRLARVPGFEEDVARVLVGVVPATASALSAADQEKLEALLRAWASSPGQPSLQRASTALL
jgi:hypothetical protein